MSATNATIMAIDILLEPDARMLQHAEVNNARLFKGISKRLRAGRNAPAAHHDGAAFRPRRWGVVVFAGHQVHGRHIGALENVANGGVNLVQSCFALIVHHDDAVREFAYDREAGLAKLDRGLDEGPKRGWTLVSVKNDWKRVFPLDAG
jgi:hypothetical protein